MDGNAHRKKNESRIEFDDDGPVVGAELIAGLLDVPVDQVSPLIARGTITTLLEKGVDEHEGTFRLSFFHRNRRARIEVGRDGHVFNRTVVDFGDRPLPASLRGPAKKSA